MISQFSSTTGYANGTDYDLYFDGTNVKLSLGNPATDPVVSGKVGDAGYVPCDARFFSIRFYGWATAAVAFDPLVVANISIITKAYELSQVIKAITGITFVQDVIIAAHSMGALDTRAYIEGLGSTYDGPCNAFPCYQAGSLSYTGDIGHVITVDGVNGGSDLATVAQLVLGLGNANVLNVDEMAPNSSTNPLVPTLNYQDSYNGVNPKSLPAGLGIDAIISSYYDSKKVPCTLSSSLCFSDGVVTTDSQSIATPLANQSLSNLIDFPDTYSIYDPSIVLDPNCYLEYVYPALHLLPCLGDWHPTAQIPTSNLLYERISPYTASQLTQVLVQVIYDGQQYPGVSLTLYGPNGQTSLTSSSQTAVLLGPAVPSSPQIPSVPPPAPVPYSLVYNSGGPAGAGSPTISVANAAGESCSPCYIQPGNWSLTFTVSFTSGNPPPPTVTTLPASGISGDGATLVGNVNPNGVATTAWFEWGPSPSLGFATAAQSVGSGAAGVSFMSILTGLESNTTYYYRLDANNGKTTVEGPSILSFVTSATLPAPTLLSPASGSVNIAIAPTFSWTAVSGATSYRIIVATTPAALPSDPTSSLCGAGCVLNDTPSGTSYIPLGGILAAGTTYYWEAHARSVLQYGSWSGVSSFSTSGPALSSATISPSTITSGSSATVTVTLNGPAPVGGAQVSLTTTNDSAFPVPSSIPISAGSTTGSVSVVGGSVSTATQVTVTGTYSGSAASGIVTVSPSGGSVYLNSFTITPSTIAGGYATQGNVFLTGPAPAGGAVVSLSSNNTHFVQVPPPQNVTVQPGYTSAAFPITTSFTSGTVGATINASYNNTTYLASVTVLPVVASGVTFYPSSVDAGSPAPFTVYLNGPAPAGTSVSLISSAPSVLQVAGSVPVPTGATSVSVTGTTFAVGSQTNVTVTATYNGGMAQGALTVVPLSLIGFSLNPVEVTGGGSVTGTVWLSDIAPSGGVNVSLVSGSSLVQVPPTANVATGASSTTFAVTTSAVSSVNNVTVTASYNGVSYNLTLTLVPPLPYLASLSFSPATVNSGSSTVGTVTLTSPAPLGGAAMSLSGSFYAVANVPNGVTVPSGATTATFTVPTAAIGFISNVNVTATYNGMAQSSLITVVPPGTPLAPSSLTLSPSVVTGGSSSTATVLLTAPAPAGGALLTLTSDNGGVQVPPVLTVGAGLNSAVFTVTSSSVTDTASATIKATYDGLSESSSLIVEPTGTEPSGNPVPFLASPLAPASQTPSGSGLSLTLNGSGFVPGAQASWNGTAVPTTYVSTTQLQASIPPANTQTNGSGSVTVTNPGPINPASNTLPEYLAYPTSAPAFNVVPLSSLEQPANVVVGDLNRDGKPDLIVGNYNTGLSVFLGNGDGTFGPELLLPGSSPASGIGDFNGDGKPDIVTTAGSSIRLYLGNGDGTFTSTPDTPFASGYLGNTSLAVGDFNGDGKLDVVVVGQQATQAYALLGNGDGTFGAPASFGSVNQPFGVAVADFNGDGKLDVAITDFNNQAVAILLGNGNGTFQSQAEYPAGGYPYGVYVADFNGDGHPDIAIATAGFCCGGSGGLSVLRNNGNGTFALPVPYGAGLRYYSVSSDDANGDGKLDLLVTDGQAGQLYLGNGDGTFAANPIPTPIGQETFAAVIVDLNDDGAPDLVATNQVSGPGNIAILLQSTEPILQVSPSRLSFTATQGGGAPASQTLAIANTGGGTETWSATTSQAWVVLGQTTGIAPSTVSVSINPSGLNLGTYTATITVTAMGAANSPQAITVTLTINPASVVVSSLAFSPNSLTGAGSATGTVTLSGLAPTGGASVALSSNNSAVQVPATMTVLAGLVSGTFTATASSVTTQTVATVTATYSGVSTTATLTLNPNTSPLTVSPTSFSFGNQGIDSTSTVKKITVTNNTGAVVTISSTVISGTNSGDFSESATTCGTALGLKKSCTISIVFNPLAVGASSATLTLTDSAVNSPQTVALSGTGVLQVTLSAATLAFGIQADGTTSVAKTVTLTNNTSSALNISSVALTGTNASEFFVSSNTCGVSVGGHSSCKIGVTFEPVTAGAKTAALTITDSANNSPQSVNLTGTGVVPVSVTPLSLTFGSQKVGTTSAAKTVTVKNNLSTTLSLNGNSLSGANATDFAQSGTTCGSTLAAGKSCTVSVTFTPSATGTRIALLSITDNSSTSPQTVSLSGTGK